MTVAKNLTSTKPVYIEPTNFENYLCADNSYCLFLDIDGTLANFTVNPKESFIPKVTLSLVEDIQRCGVKVAVITGRSLVEAQQMLLPLQLTIVATHGLEFAFMDDKNASDSSNTLSNVITISSINTVELDTIKKNLRQSCAAHHDLIIENKPYSVALHYRQNLALAATAESIVYEIARQYPNWALKQGKCVWELIPKNVDKGTAILTLLQRMQSSDALYPIFIGDDLTDEAGFIAIQDRNLTTDTVENDKFLPGMGIKVGNEPTEAHYYVNDINEVTVLLASFLNFLQKNKVSFSALADTKFSKDNFLSDRSVNSNAIRLTL